MNSKMYMHMNSKEHNVPILIFFISFVKYFIFTFCIVVTEGLKERITIINYIIKYLNYFYRNTNNIYNS